MRKKRIRRVFSDTFKLEKVRMLESGEIRVCDLVRMYNVSPSAINKWRKKFGSLPPSERVVIEKGSEFEKNKELARRIQDLEQMIGRQQVRLDYYEKVVSHTNKLFKVDVEKKYGQG